eukprot:3676840-Ditylum_brightwellii.AAC.1
MGGSIGTKNGLGTAHRLGLGLGAGYDCRAGLGVTGYGRHCRAGLGTASCGCFVAAAAGEWSCPEGSSAGRALQFFKSCITL